MYERYTDRARRAVILADELRREHNLPEISTDLLVVALVLEGESSGDRGSIAAQALRSIGLSTEILRLHLNLSAMQAGAALAPGRLSGELRHVLSTSALRAALAQKVSYVAPEHLLLGVIGDEESAGSRLLLESGVNLDTVRSRVEELLAAPAPPTPTSGDGAAEAQRVAAGLRSFARKLETGETNVPTLLARLAEWTEVQRSGLVAADATR